MKYLHMYKHICKYMCMYVYMYTFMYMSIWRCVVKYVCYIPQAESTSSYIMYALLCFIDSLCMRIYISIIKAHTISSFCLHVFLFHILDVPCLPHFLSFFLSIAFLFLFTPQTFLHHRLSKFDADRGHKPFFIIVSLNSMQTEAWADTLIICAHQCVHMM